MNTCVIPPWWLNGKEPTCVCRKPGQSLGREDPLNKEMATQSSTLTRQIPWTEEPGGLQSMGHKELDMTEQLTLSLSPILQLYN